MTDVVETDLFGGTIKANYPKNFIDASYVIDCQSKPGSVPTYFDLAYFVKSLTPRRYTYLNTRTIASS